MANKTSLLDQVRSGRPLSKSALGCHLGVDRDKAVEIAAATGLALEGATYPWRRIWRQIHGIEGSHLAAHLDDLKARHPDSAILGGITDLEAELRAPLIKFPAMTKLLGAHPDTLRKQIQRGARTLPFPTLHLCPRLRLYRPLEVRLWRDEEIRLDLPPAVQVAAPKPRTPIVAKPRPHAAPVDPREAIFGGFGRSNGTGAG